MQLLSDAISAFGSRIGIAIEPCNSKAYLIRFSEHPGIECQIKAGVKIEGTSHHFPLCDAASHFQFMEQESTPTSIQIKGIVPEYGIQVELTFRMIFCPENMEISTIPAIIINLSVSRLNGDFRWTKQKDIERVPLELFFSMTPSEGKTSQQNTTSVILTYPIKAPYPNAEGAYAVDNRPDHTKPMILSDLLTGFNCTRELTEFSRTSTLARGQKDECFNIIYTCFDNPVMQIHESLSPFWYTRQFSSKEEVAIYVREHREELVAHSEAFDSQCREHNLGTVFDHLCSSAVHSWLINTWVVGGDQDLPWYTVWEGNCYFTSTVDVEYSMTPFYLLFWPELIRLQLFQWRRFLQEPEPSSCLSGSYVSHDTGQFLRCSQQYYPHHMEIEECANYILMAFAYLTVRETDQETINTLNSTIRALSDYILSADTLNTGIPAEGCSNTIDDASPAIQFGNQQVYLGIKAYCAILAASRLLKEDDPQYLEYCERARSTIESNGWKNDHFVVNCLNSAEGLTDPWSGVKLQGDLEGWDAYHIFSTNGIILFDMLRIPSGLDEKKLSTDIRTSITNTRTRYGCRHTSYRGIGELETKQGLAGASEEVGWISMNLLRDAAALYRGIDVTSLLQNYWDWITTVNSQEITLFFETFGGNNLCFYPRGLALFALYAADRFQTNMQTKHF